VLENDHRIHFCLGLWVMFPLFALLCCEWFDGMTGARFSFFLWPCSIVEFSTPEEAQNAIKTLNDTSLTDTDRMIFVREVSFLLVPPPLPLFVILKKH